ncbi:hypothetical protein ACF3OJ_11680 [Cardiobacterium hominis]|uniref:Uncharacterized protein n=1 Tax=Cardiobacterium hominis TaxID=2718 RepID=A0A1C3H2L0_9GAMM|nr:hypothetical protein [Cardiobacterium hominis]SAM58992.1 hypothetical protein CHUV0807_0513 [Cardiobacterium hominis]
MKERLLRNRLQQNATIGGGINAMSGIKSSQGVRGGGGDPALRLQITGQRLERYK